MSISNERTTEILADLIRRLHDSANGYRRAAEMSDTPRLEREFYRLAEQCTSFAGDLAEEMRCFGAEAPDTGSAEGGLHRAWLSLREVVGGDDALLREVERGEEEQLDAYRGALDHDLPDPVEETVRTQMAALLSAHERDAVSA